MREYLRATELMPDLAGPVEADFAGDASAVDSAVAAAQVECQLLLAALETALPRRDSRGFETLLVRFQKFKTISRSTKVRMNAGGARASILRSS
jgi:hypothetical protein